MIWTSNERGGTVTLIATEDDVQVAVAVARPRFAAPGQGIAGWTITRLRFADGLRGDPSFTERFIPEMMEQVKQRGWMTDEDLLDYRWEDDGIHVGSLHVMIPPEGRHRLLAQRAVMRDEVDKIAAEAGVEVAEPLTEEVAVLVELKDLTREEVAELRKLRG